MKKIVYISLLVLLNTSFAFSQQGLASWSSTTVVPLSMFLGWDTFFTINPSSDVILALEGSRVLLMDNNGCHGRYLQFDKDVSRVACSHDHSFLVVSLVNGEVLVSDYFGTILKSYTFNEAITSICISPDDTWIALGDWGGKLKIIDLQNNTITIAGSKKRTPLGMIKKVDPPYQHSGKIKTIQITPKNNIISWSSNVVKFWNKEGYLQKTLHFQSTAFPIVASCDHATFSKSRFAFIDRGKLISYNLLGKKIMKIALGDTVLSAAGISKSGNIIGGSFDGDILIWDMDGTLLKKIKICSSSIFSIDVSADEAFMVVGTTSDGTFIIHNNSK